MKTICLWKSGRRMDFLHLTCKTSPSHLGRKEREGFGKNWSTKDFLIKTETENVMYKTAPPPFPVQPFSLPPNHLSICEHPSQLLVHQSACKYPSPLLVPCQPCGIQPPSFLSCFSLLHTCFSSSSLSILFSARPFSFLSLFLLFSLLPCREALCLLNKLPYVISHVWHGFRGILYSRQKSDLLE